MYKILLVEDNPSFRLFLKETLKDLAIINEASNINEAKKYLQNEKYNLLLLDLKLPDGNGISLIEDKTINVEKIIILTGHGNIPLAIKAIKSGAYDFWTKPISYDFLLNRIKRLKMIKDRQESMEEQLVGTSQNIIMIRELIKDIAPSDVNVLITGESGTGKELIARLIHNYSGREGEFVPIDLSIISKELFESELFGSIKGSYTGADVSREGRVSKAKGGTIFFDNIDSLPFDYQGKILRFIDTKAFYPLGSNKERFIDVRFIFSVSNNINDLIQKGLFRKELFFRINVQRIDVLPLRERREDIVPIAKYLIDKYCKKYNKSIVFDNTFFDNLIYNDFPGNVRELDNIIQSIFISGNINVNKNYIKEGLKDKIERMKKELEIQEIKKVLLLTNGNKKKASEILKISYRSLLDKIKEYGIE